jgi:hypothetical protein
MQIFFAGQPVFGNNKTLVSRILIHHGAAPSDSTGPQGHGGNATYAYPEFQANDMAEKFKTWFYTCTEAAAKRKDRHPGLLCLDIHNCLDHWSGCHDMCRLINPERPCVKENWSRNYAYFSRNGAAYEALDKWLDRHITRKKMAHYLRARENFLSETFNSLINKYATKRINWQKVTLPGLRAQC